MRSKTLLALAFVSSLIAFFPATTEGQPVFRTYQSLEARIAQARSVVRGSISQCSGAFIERQGGYFGGRDEAGRRRADGVMRYVITVQVLEAIKGNAPKTIELVQETSADDKRF